MIDIVHYPNKILRRKTKSVKKLTKVNINKIKSMFRLMYQLDGIGLAAPQVGWNANVFVMNISGCIEDERVFINPKIKGESGKIWELNEGCLSLPNINCVVQRFYDVEVEAVDLSGRTFRVKEGDLVGRCILHECDHLNGVLIVDRAKYFYCEDKSESRQDSHTFV